MWEKIQTKRPFKRTFGYTYIRVLRIARKRMFSVTVIHKKRSGNKVYFVEMDNVV